MTLPSLLIADANPAAPAKTIAALFLLPDCDMACDFCASELGFDRMGFEQAVALFDDLVAAGYESVVLGGGEPCLWRDPQGRDLGDLARAARERGLVVQVNTNGIRLPEEPDAATHLPRYLTWPDVDRFVFPMDGASPERHDELRLIKGRRPEGHFTLVQRRVVECTAAGQALTIGTVLTSRNVDQVPALIDWMGERVSRGTRIHAWHLYRFVPVGRGGATAELDLDPEPYAAACDAAKAAGLPFPVWRRSDMTRPSTVEFLWYEKGELKLGSQEWRAPAMG